MKTYVVAVTPRCGSSLLCEALAATGLAGRPGEFLGPESGIRRHVEAIGFPSVEAAIGDLPAYLATVRRLYASANGSFGIKLSWDQVEWLRSRGASVDDLLGPCRFVYLVRGDLTRQAISLVRAKQTGAWRSTEAPRCDPEFDPVEIRNMIFWLTRQGSGWESFFATRRDAPLRIVYETYVPELARTVVRILSFLGIPFDGEDVARRLATAPAGLERQADAISEAWVQQYTDYLAAMPMHEAASETDGHPQPRRRAWWWRLIPEVGKR